MSPLVPPIVRAPLWPLPAFRAGIHFLGPFTSPPALIGTFVVLLLLLVVGRVPIGLAWRLVLVALVILIGLWLLGALGTGFGPVCQPCAHRPGLKPASTVIRIATLVDKGIRIGVEGPYSELRIGMSHGI